MYDVRQTGMVRGIVAGCDRVADGLRAVSVAAFVALWGAAASVYGSVVCRPVLARVRSSRRGAGMLEYALIAAIAVGVFIFLRGFLNGLFGRLTGDINDKLQNPVQAPVSTTP